MAKKNKDAKKEKKAAKKAGKPLDMGAKAGKASLKAGMALASHPAVAEVVAAALVGAAAALRNPKKARALANAGSEKLEALGKEAADKGSALWALAIEVGRRSLETFDLVPPETAKPSAPRKAAAARKPAAKRKPAVKKPAAKKPAAKKPAAKKPAAKKKAPAKKA